MSLSCKSDSVAKLIHKAWLNSRINKATQIFFAAEILRL